MEYWKSTQAIFRSLICEVIPFQQEKRWNCRMNAMLFNECELFVEIYFSALEFEELFKILEEQLHVPLTGEHSREGGLTDCKKLLLLLMMVRRY
jgi:hypothetical protein